MFSNFDCIGGLFYKITLATRVEILQIASKGAVWLCSMHKQFVNPKVDKILKSRL